MALMWFSLGLLVGLSVYAASELSKRFDPDWRGWTGLALGELTVLFCIAWSVAAVAEGEPQAASMGVMFFGAPGVAILALSWRLLVAPTARRAKA